MTSITNKINGVLYIGFSNDLKRRIKQHRNKVHPNTFSARYNLNRLVYFEYFINREEALIREKRMKKWKREWKTSLIEESNLEWKDLFDIL